LSAREWLALGSWGPDGARVHGAESYWRQLKQWNAAAAAVGEVSVFAGFRDSAPCFECWQTHAAILPEAAGDPAVAAMLSGAVRALVGTLLATEAIKFALGLEPTLSGSLLVCDALDLSIRKTAVDKNPSCPICAESV